MYSEALIQIEDKCLKQSIKLIKNDNAQTPKARRI